eukprot:6663566-Alexandrium_andersonii.AAC.1
MKCRPSSVSRYALSQSKRAHSTCSVRNMSKMLMVENDGKVAMADRLSRQLTRCSRACVRK